METTKMITIKALLCLNCLTMFINIYWYCNTYKLFLKYYPMCSAQDVSPSLNMAFASLIR